MKSILGYNLTKKKLSNVVFASEINLSYLSFVQFLKRFFMEYEISLDNLFRLHFSYHSPLKIIFQHKRRVLDTSLWWLSSVVDKSNWNLANVTSSGRYWLLLTKHLVLPPSEHVINGCEKYRSCMFWYNCFFVNSSIDAGKLSLKIW